MYIRELKKAKETAMPKIMEGRKAISELNKTVVLEREIGVEESVAKNQSKKKPKDTREWNKGKKKKSIISIHKD